MKLFVVGRVNKVCEDWSFIGVFDNKDLAESHCSTEDHFIGPCELNEAASGMDIDWPGAYYPKPVEGEKPWDSSKTNT